MPAPATSKSSEPQSAPKRQLTLLDTTSIIVGIIIGSSIYESTWLIASNVPNVAALIGVWVLGGLLSLIGALCYVELANAFPVQGGDYVYLTQAFGRKTGFLFAWAQLWVVRPGSIGAMAYVFARYADQLRPLGEEQTSLLTYAAGSVVVLTAINLLGVREGKWTQNLLTIVKFLGLAAVFAVGLVWSTPVESRPVSPEGGSFDIRSAMILILYAYGGWNEMAYVGSEVRDPRKNILRALVLGTVAVTLLYVLLNLAFVHALGMEGTRQAKAVASEVMKLGFGDRGSHLISVLICISALGAINGMIFTGARIYYAMGQDHRLYRWLGQWNSRRDTPISSLLIQAAITLPLVIGFGLMKTGTQLKQSGFESMVNFTAPVFWIFFLLVGISLFVLRYRQPTLPRPYRVPGYPLVPILFCLSSSFMVYASVSWAIANQSSEAFWSIALLAAGVAMSFYDPQAKSPITQ